jgi:hypothetical protein
MRSHCPKILRGAIHTKVRGRYIGAIASIVANDNEFFLFLKIARMPDGQRAGDRLYRHQENLEFLVKKNPKQLPALAKSINTIHGIHEEKTSSPNKKRPRVNRDQFRRNECWPPVSSDQVSNIVH